LAEDSSRMLCLAPQLEQQASGWVLGDGGTRAVTEDGPGGVTGMARVGSPKNAALEGGVTAGRLTELTW